MTTLTTHLPIVNPSSINRCKDLHQKQWEAVCEEVDKRRDLASSGKEHLSLYLEEGGAFGAWLKGAEALLVGLTLELNCKEKLFSQIQDFEVTGGNYTCSCSTFCLQWHRLSHLMSKHVRRI